MKITKSILDEITYEIIGAAIEVHKELGPGLLESIYHKCLAKEFELRGIRFASEMLVGINYKGLKIDSPLRCDFLIENIIVLEIKSVSELIPRNDAQIITYMNLLKKPKGILINFNVTNIFKEGQKTFVNEFFRALPE